LNLRVCPSTGAVDVAAVLYPVDDNRKLIFVDLVDDAIVTASCGTQTLEFAHQPLAESLRVVGYWPQDSFQRRDLHLVRQAVEMSQTLGSDLDLIQPVCSDLIAQMLRLAFGRFASRPSQRLHKFFVSGDIERFLERLKIVGTDQNKRGSTVTSHQDAVMLALDAVGQFGEVGLDLREGECLAHTPIIGQNSD